MGCQIALGKNGVVGLNGKLSMVRCKICIKKKKHKKKFIPKFDGVKKHIGCWKVFVIRLGVTKVQYVASLTNQHANNKHQFTTLHGKSYIFDHF